ncbi:MAG: transposase [Porticoccus sp.]|nr:transposase [Porticoccus sp.]MBQ0808373.1 transposase [Porticoccus sp.]
MSRLPRFCPVGLPQHIIQRGNNRSVCFADEQDFSAYAHWLKEYADKFEVSIHAWVFMTNHVHLLATPAKEDGVQLLMQSLGRRYVQYFNFTYRRSGTLWEGRYKSCAVQQEDYLLACYRYIELNPVRAGMVTDPSDYIWSSYHSNGLGVKSTLCTPHSEYMALGDNLEKRLSSYRELLKGHVDSDLITDIRQSINRGLLLGSERFKDEVELLYGRRVKPAKMGRPKKSCT